MTNIHVKPNPTKPSVTSVLRKIARERAKTINRREIAPESPPGKLPFSDAIFLSKFISESAFYIEELERHIGEELHDYWQTREHALRILTDIMIEHPQANA